MRKREDPVLWWSPFRRNRASGVRRRKRRRRWAFRRCTRRHRERAGGRSAGHACQVVSGHQPTSASGYPVSAASRSRSSAKATFMCYDEYLARGLPIPTGVVGGACGRPVEDRRALSGRCWNLDDAKALPALRCVHDNGDWDAFHAFRRRQGLHVCSCDAPSVSPSSLCCVLSTRAEILTAIEREGGTSPSPPIAPRVLAPACVRRRLGTPACSRSASDTPRYIEELAHGCLGADVHGQPVVVNVPAPAHGPIPSGQYGARLPAVKSSQPNDRVISFS